MDPIALRTNHSIVLPAPIELYGVVTISKTCYMLDHPLVITEDNCNGIHMTYRPEKSYGAVLG